MTTTETTERVTVWIKETGEVYAKVRGPITDPEFKGWLLRCRTGFYRKTGFHLTTDPAKIDPR